MYITVEDAKKQILVDDYYHDDDTYISDLIKAAEEAVSLRIDRNLSDTLIDGELPSSIRQSILLLVGNWYANREPVSFGSANEIPYTFEYLNNLNKRYEMI